MCIVFLFTISKCLDTFEHVIMVKLPNIRSKFGQLINYLLKNIYIYKKQLKFSKKKPDLKRKQVK